MKRNKLLYFFAACGLSVMCLLGGCGTNNSDTTTNNDTNTTKTENDAKQGKM